MILPLYSDGHLDSAKILFPEKVIDSEWYQQRWTDQEINICKEYELGAPLRRNPTIGNWEKLVLGETPIQAYSDEILDLYLHVIQDTLPKVLSVGSGQGYREVALALRATCKTIVALDFVPYLDSLHKMLTPELAAILRFMQGDAYDLPFKDNSFDLVTSHALIYCIPDKHLTPYFNEILRVLKPGGVCIVSTVANISIKDKINILLGRETIPAGWKQTGWSRDTHHIRKHIPATAKINRIHHFRHDKVPPVLMTNGEANGIGRLIIWLSRHIYPLINSIVAFELTKL